MEPMKNSVVATRNGSGSFSDHLDASSGGNSDSPSVAKLTKASDHRPSTSAPSAAINNIAQIASMALLLFWISEIIAASVLKNGSDPAYIGPMDGNLIRIASYNIRKARGLDQRRLPMRSLEVVNSLAADIVLLQEADLRLGDRKPAIAPRLIEAETDFKLLDVSANAISSGWHGNAVLVRKGACVTSIARLDLPGTEPRGAVRIDLPIGDGLTIVAAHLGLMRRDRRAQFRTLRDLTADQPNVVIAGDFNEWSADRGLEPLAGRFDVHAPGRSFHARRPVASLDRFALTSNIALLDAGVEQGALAKRASDHLPVWADVAVPAPISA